MKPGFLCLLAALAPAWAQLPAINPGGVVNAASYTTGIADLSGSYPQTGGGPTLAGGSLASIFGTNLAAVPLSGQPPFPRQLGGTSVSVYGIAAPLLFVSPNQINFQIPSGNDTTPGASSAPGVVVTTAVGQSVPYQIALAEVAPGIFTRNGSGCGEGAVLNVAPDGSVSVNSATNSAAPGSFISIYGTGNGFVENSPPDGVPAPTQPLAVSNASGGTPVLDFSEGGLDGLALWEGRAPGLVGVDQTNFLIPATARQGCTVPLQIQGDNISPPVTVSIASGGGPCSDPPEQGYGEVTWEKTTTTAADYTVTTAETVTLSLQESPGRQAPTPVTYTEGGVLPGYSTYYGPACPIPGYRSLDAGAVTVQGPGLAATTAQLAPLSGGTVINILPQGGATLTSQVQSNQAAGLSVYQATLPSGTIQPGSFTVAAAGGADVGAFQSTVQIGSPIQIVTALAARVLDGSGPPFTIQWTGGDANSWVTLKLVSNYGGGAGVPWAWTARASDGQITIQGDSDFIGFGTVGPVEIVIDVVPDPSQIGSVTAKGLSLGGQARWKYSYRFEGALATSGAP